MQLALRCGSQKFPLGIRVAAIRAGVYTSVKKGGTLIEYDDEDPAIRRTYESELAAKGIAPNMNYRRPPPTTIDEIQAASYKNANRRPLHE